jgi:hypothetical protein
MLLCIAIPFTAFGDGRGKGVGSSIEWSAPPGAYESATLEVSMPNGEVITREYAAGRIHLRVSDLGTDVTDGAYNYEVTFAPKVSADLKKKLENARKANDDAAARKALRDAGISATVYSGTFTIDNGSIVDTEAVESGAGNAEDEVGFIRSGDDQDVVTPAPSTRGGKVAVDDQVIPDDLIVQGSGCFGFDCVNNESFGFDTIRLKENNLRIKAEDTSAGSFPTNDWQLTFNDSASGGANKFSVEDITGAKVPLTVTAGAATNSIFVDSTGRVGFRTSTPVLDLHVATSNTPAIRLEQNNSGGFTAQTWDIAGNEANFFVRDVTGGSRLPFRIRPGAPTSSLDISADGSVGINTASPNSNAKLDVNGAIRLPGLSVAPTTDSGAWQWNESGAGYVFQSGGNIRFRTGGSTAPRLSVSAAGDVGINCSTPTADFVIFATSDCSGSGSTINAGATQFTVASSRTIKEHLIPVAVPDVLDRISKVEVYNYDFKDGAKNRLGLMAEDFHSVFERGSNKVIDGTEVQMALWLAVQQLTEQNKLLQERLDALEQQKQ